MTSKKALHCASFSRCGPTAEKLIFKTTSVSIILVQKLGIEFSSDVTSWLPSRRIDRSRHEGRREGWSRDFRRRPYLFCGTPAFHWAKYVGTLRKLGSERYANWGGDPASGPNGRREYRKTSMADAGNHVTSLLSAPSVRSCQFS